MKGYPMYMPGIILFSGSILQDPSNDFVLNSNPKLYSKKLSLVGEVRLQDWLIGRVITRLNREDAVYEGADGISVLFDGYISEFVGTQNMNITTHKPAAAIAHLYRELGQKFLAGLRGSFVALIADNSSGTALLFNDRLGSRPLFFRELNKGSIVVCPEVIMASSVQPRLATLSKEAVGEFINRGGFCFGRTLIKGISKFPQAGKLTLKKGQHEIDNYWRLQFSKTPLDVNENDLIEQYDYLLLQATRRCLKSVKNPVLCLSGGRDSRLVLSCLLKEGIKGIPAVSWEAEDTEGDDLAVAKKVANHCRLPYKIYKIRMCDFSKTAGEAVRRADGHPFILDAPSLIHLWDQLGLEHDSFFTGDEWRIGWRGNVSSIPEAFNAIELSCFEDSWRVAEWFRRPILKTISTAMRQSRLANARNTGETNMNSIKNILYYQERIGNWLNGWSAAKLDILEQARPKLDEDVIDFITTLPVEMRTDQLLTKRLMARKYSDLDALPYSKADSLPLGRNFSNALPCNNNLQQFVISNLTEKLHPKLIELLDLHRINSTMQALSKGNPLPQRRGGWAGSLPGLWRIMSKKNQVDAMTGALRLLQLSLYMNELDDTIDMK